MYKPEPSEVFEVRRHDIEPARIAELADAAGYAYIAVKGQVYQVTGAGSQLGYRGPVCAVDELGRDTTPKVDRSTLAEPEPTLAEEHEGPAITVLDGLYADPLRARAKALESDLEAHPERHKGLRSSDFPIPSLLREIFESVTGPVGHGHSCFQLNIAGEELVYHSDQQRWAAAIYLTPDAPPEGGTSFWRSRHTRARSSVDLDRMAGKDGWPSAGELEVLTYGGALLDRTRWQEVDRVGNVFNRLAIWDARLIHSVSECFGHDRETGRLCQLFFWNQA
jgi:predicted heme/steroid binding protein